MPHTQLPKSSSDPEVPLGRSTRPRFHHRCTEDRLREGSGRPPSFSMSRKTTKERKSVFRELGLDTDDPSGPYSSEHEFAQVTGLASPTTTPGPGAGNDHASDDGKVETERKPAQQGQDDHDDEFAQSPASPSTSQRPWYSRLTRARRPRIKTVSSAPPPSLSTMTRLSSIALLIAVLLPGFSYYSGRQTAAPVVADAGVIHTPGPPGPVLEGRAGFLSDVCGRWAYQAAQFSEALCICDSQATMSEDQTADIWSHSSQTEPKRVRFHYDDLAVNNFLASELPKA